MSNYTITTNFGAKDSLPSGNAAKVIKGSEFTTEFTNIATAVNSKADTAGDTFTGAVTFDAAVTINSTATITGDLTVDTNTLFVDASTDRVGIGTNAPTHRLMIQRNDTVGSLGSASIGLHPEYESGGGSYIRWGGSSVAGAKLRFVGVGDAERMRIDSSGNFMVGTTDNIARNGGFSVITGAVDYINVGHASSVASGNYYAAFRHGNNTIGTITQNGTTGVLYNTSSDERLKENITDSADAGSRVDAIQIRQFDWKVDGTHQDYGVIAQELVTVAPEAVHQPVDDEDMMGVDYSKLVPLLVKEVQALRSRVAQLEESE